MIVGLRNQWCFSSTVHSGTETQRGRRTSTTLPVRRERKGNEKT